MLSPELVLQVELPAEPLRQPACHRRLPCVGRATDPAHMGQRLPEIEILAGHSTLLQVNSACFSTSGHSPPFCYLGVPAPLLYPARKREITGLSAGVSE